MSVHIPVLMNEVIESLDIQSNDIIIDGTINGGGHAQAIAERLGNDGMLIGIDQDRNGLTHSKERLRNVKPKIELVHGNTRNLDGMLDAIGIQTYDKLFLDLGWSSNQFEDPLRGFSFKHDGPLTMTLSDDPNQVPFTAYDVVNEWSEESLVDILIGYGEERFARRIARAIIDARTAGSITGTLKLAEIIQNAIPKRFQNGPIHPATQSFQAIRIAVNDEIGALKEILEKGWERLNPNGRMVIISFHSIEDRIVKHYFRTKKMAGEAEILTKKPITPTDEEMEHNRRSRSAKLRILQKL
ncbi:16S rRNA (cytosine(1402)-N(4))-methyltransferase RsmH [Patescibacteria group bacterium]|nr:16S rRNA (cytosine(1402)-N(4))-methyltransferase RsmH [Patescibacteria group bacterium]